MRPLIGLAGLIGAGKTTAAMHLVNEHGFRRIPFAAPLRDMLRGLGLTERELTIGKEEPCELLGGKTPRQAMQLLGTEWGRNLIDPHLWVRAWTHAVINVPTGMGVVADDVRFPNEAISLRTASPFSLVARIARVDRTEPPVIEREPPRAHASELQTFRADVTLVNDGSVNDLKRKIDQLVTARLQESMR